MSPQTPNFENQQDSHPKTHSTVVTREMTLKEPAYWDAPHPKAQVREMTPTLKVREAHLLL